MLARDGVLIWDSEGEFCQPGENRFFSITDREGGRLPDPSCIIYGQRVTATQIMAFGDGWIPHNSFIPFAYACQELGITPTQVERAKQDATASGFAEPPQRPTRRSAPLPAQSDNQHPPTPGGRQYQRRPP
jgi:hypothetical protein